MKNPGLGRGFSLLLQQEVRSGLARCQEALDLRKLSLD
jgi:hypothetical protein